MREIISIQIGECGNNIGELMWESMWEEHNLEYIEIDENNRGAEKVGTFLKEMEGERIRYSPRCVIIGKEERLSRTRNKKGIYSEKSYSEAMSVGGTWAAGYYGGESRGIVDIEEIIRGEMEAAENAQGFQVLHSTGGGLGSGFGALIMYKLKEEYPGKLTRAFSVLPALDSALDNIQTHTTRYNTILGFHYLAEYADQVFYLDNEGLMEICTRSLGLDPHIIYMNELIREAMSGVTAGDRGSAALQGEMGMLALQQNMVPFTALNALVISLSSILPHPIYIHPSGYRDFTHTLLQPRNLLAGIDTRHGRFLSISTLFRGGAFTQESLSDAMLSLPMSYNSSYFVEWIPNNIRTSYTPLNYNGHLDHLPPSHYSGILIGNSTAMQEIWKKVVGPVNGKLTSQQRKCLERYLSEGMDSFEIIDAIARMNDQIAECSAYQDAAAQEQLGDWEQGD